MDVLNFGGLKMPGWSKEGFVEILKWKIRGCLNGGWMSNEQVVERIKRVSRLGVACDGALIFERGGIDRK